MRSSTALKWEFPRKKGLSTNSMMRYLTAGILIAALLLTAAGCTTAGQIFGTGEERITLTIIQTGDIKGALFPDDDATSSLAHLASVIREQRDSTDNLVLFDLGNTVREGEIGYYYDYLHPGLTHIQADVLNFLNYDAAVAGSREIGSGANVFNRTVLGAEAPMLGANMVNRTSGEPINRPYKIIRRDNLRIAVLGLVDPHARFGIPERNWPAMTILPIIESAHRWVQIIKDQESPDVVVVLLHAGGDAIYRHAVDCDEFSAEPQDALPIAQRLAKSVPGIDIVFTNEGNADMYTQVRTERGSQVHIISTREYAESAAVLTADFFRMRNTDFFTIQHVQVSHVSALTQVPDQGFMTHFADAQKRIDVYRKQFVADVESSIPATGCLYGESCILRLVHDVQLKLTSAHVSFAAAPVVSSSLEQGPMLIGDFFRLFPHESYIYSLRMTGQEIKDYLEFSYGGWFNTMQGPYDHLIRFVTDDQQGIVRNEQGMPQFYVPPYQFDVAAGIDYTVDISKQPGNRIQIIQLSSGRPFNAHETYIVAVNSFRYAGGGGHLAEGVGFSLEELFRRVITVSSRSLRHHILQHLMEVKSITDCTLENWYVIPESWGAAGRINDNRLLYE